MSATSQVTNDFYVTDIPCACGCGTLLNSLMVAKGRKYLWGHKGGAGKIHNKSLNGHIAPPKLKPGVSTNMESITDFISAQRTLVTTEIKRLEQENEKTRYAITDLKQKLEKLNKAQAAIKEL